MRHTRFRATHNKNHSKAQAKAVAIPQHLRFTVFISMSALTLLMSIVLLKL